MSSFQENDTKYSLHSPMKKTFMLLTQEIKVDNN